jgi:hypothetical protein
MPLLGTALIEGNPYYLLFLVCLICGLEAGVRADVCHVPLGWLSLLFQAICKFLTDDEGFLDVILSR